MSPRMPVGVRCAPSGQVANHARDVRGEHINPASVAIDGREVINAAGEWVGPDENLVVRRASRESAAPSVSAAPRVTKVSEARGDVGPRGDPGPPGERGPGE